MSVTLIVTAMVAALAVVGGSGSAASPTASYIVVLDSGVDDVPGVAADLARGHGGRVGFVYEHAIAGFSMTMSPQAAEALARNPRVAYVETDDPVSIDAQQVPTGVERIFADTNALDIDGADDARVDVDVAVIDTGIDFEHPDLDVVGGVTCRESGGGPPWARSASCTSGGDDDHYHGTHVAGTVGALDNGEGVVGVAPGARLWAVKVLGSNGSGSESMVVAGIDWVAANADTIEVANMSLGGSGFSQAEYDAIQGAVDAGVAFAVAAGNSADDAGDYSPAAFDNVVTVSALADFDGRPGGLGASTCRTDQDDTLADFSNWGPAVQITAPGVCITSTYPLERGGYGTISGTSMASPHVAGALALLASTANPNSAADVARLYTRVVGAGNFDWTDDSGDGAKEPLLDVSGFSPTLRLVGGDGGGGGGEAGDTTAPAVTISEPGEGATFDQGTSVTFEGTASDDTDGDLSSTIAWSSPTVGALGTGATITTAALPVGEHVVTASATDTAGNVGTATVTITVLAAPDGGDAISLSVTPRKDRGWQWADLTWSGAVGTDVDVYRDGVVVATASNDGAYADQTGAKGGGSAVYQVCEAGSATACSPAVTATW